MKILFLSPHGHLVSFLESFGDEVVDKTDKLDSAEGFDWIVSYGYRYKITQEMLEQVNGRAINLHISYLPYNRGADPTFWSVAEDTPRGVTIHVVDSEIDTGPILAQVKYDIDIENDTFRTLYARASETLESLFMRTWSYIRDGELIASPQVTCHKVKDKDRLWHLMTDGWDMPISKLLGVGR